MSELVIAVVVCASFAAGFLLHAFFVHPDLAELRALRRRSSMHARRTPRRRPTSVVDLQWYRDGSDRGSTA